MPQLVKRTITVEEFLEEEIKDLDGAEEEDEEDGDEEEPPKPTSVVPRRK